MEADRSLREALVARLERAGVFRSAAVGAALRTVPRHAFLPDLSLEDAYADRAVAIKEWEGAVLSSVSQPAMIAEMLDLLDVRPGQRVLEIGTGSGYNAALLSELTGPSGTVTSVELDAQLAAQAKARLASLGYANVRVLEANGAAPELANERYDRLVVTARTDDVAEPWWTIASQGARCVIPLRLEAAGEFAIGFDYEDGALHSVGLYPCAFIPMRDQPESDSAQDVFFRDPSRSKTPHTRPIESVIAVKRADATPQLLTEADIVIARPTTVFAVKFA